MQMVGRAKGKGKGDGDVAPKGKGKGADTHEEVGTSAPKREDYTFDGFYTDFCRRPHEALYDFGYKCAYKRSDADGSMKTTLFSGCIDWIYIRRLGTRQDEQVISAVKEGFSDHNAVMVTLQL